MHFSEGGLRLALFGLFILTIDTWYLISKDECYVFVIAILMLFELVRLKHIFMDQMILLFCLLCHNKLDPWEFYIIIDIAKCFLKDPLSLLKTFSDGQCKGSSTSKQTQRDHCWTNALYFNCKFMKIYYVPT